MQSLEQLHPHGLFTRGEALDLGYSDRDLIAARRDGQIHRVRHGVYAPKLTWDHFDDLARYRLRGQAVCLVHQGRVALSHTSGAVEHGLRLWRPDLRRVHVTRLDGAPGRVTTDAVHHESASGVDDVQEKEEWKVLDPITCALEAAALADTENGVVILDSVLDLGLATVDSLWSAYSGRMQRWPGTQKLQVSLRLSRPGAQSVGESRVRVLCWTQHLPEPTLQFEVRDASGRLVGVVDFAWPQHELLGEFDGKVKYEQLLRPGQTASDAVFAEKRREDRIREITQWRLIRLVWSDLSRPTLTAGRLLRLMQLPMSA